MIEDPYLLLYLASFLPICDFVRFSCTSRLFTQDPLMMDALSKRILQTTTAQIITTDDELLHSTVILYNFGNKTHLIFSGLSIPLPQFTPEYLDDRVTIRISTPCWNFRWTGYVNYNDTTDLKYTNFLVNADKTGFASLQLQLYYDDNGISITEIRFAFIRNIRLYFRWYYVRRYVFALGICIVTGFLMSYYDGVFGRFVAAFYAGIVAVFITRDVSYSSCPIKVLPNIV